MNHATQDRIWANKIAKGFGLTDVPMELCLLQGEIVELREAELAGDAAAVQDELADVVIFTYALARMVNVRIRDLPLTSPEGLYSPEPLGLDRAVADFFKAWQREAELDAKLHMMMQECERIAYNHGIDVLSAVEAKVTRNEQRHYVRVGRGHVKTS